MSQEVFSFAPGRVEILGNHTDYNGGVVLSAALQLGISAAAHAGPDVRLQSSAMPERVLPLIGADTKPCGQWTDYPAGVAYFLQRAGAPIGGFTMRFESTLPHGAGLSSSAALEVATAVALRKLFSVSMSRLETAKLCRRAENEFVGVNCGLLDQASSVFGRKDHLVFLDCRAESVETISLPEHFSLVIVNSAVKHALTGGEYNERREQCHAAAAALGAEALRDVNMARLEEAELPDIVKRRARHIVGENERVLEAVEALRAGQGRRLGALMTASHRSSMANFENSTRELDILVEIATSQPGCLGARLTGGGFGGAIVALVESSAAASVLEKTMSLYRERTGISPEGFIGKASDGALPGEDSL
jgi:galactokinase